MQETILHQKFHHLLDTSERVLLVAHKKPDGDTMGSSSSILNYLKSKGKKAVAFCVDEIPESFHYLPNWQEFTNDPLVWQEVYDLICVFDSGDLQYAGVASLFEKLPGRPMVVNLDHHITNVCYGDLNLLFTDASSTAEIVYRFYQANQITVDPHMATCLLTGIITDTSNFINPATNALCIQAASDLLVCGARLQDIVEFLVKNKSITGLQLWGRALERIKENTELGIASTVITEADVKEAGGEAGDVVEGLANFLGATLNVPVIMVLREMPGGFIKGSLRSTSKDVSAIAKLLGGGGHKKASGFTVKGKLIEKDGVWQVAAAEEIVAT